MADAPKRWPGTQKVSFNVSINWFVFVGIAAVALICTYLYVSDANRPALVFIASILAGGWGLLAFVNNLDQRKEQRERDNQKTQDQRQREDEQTRERSE